MRWRAYGPLVSLLVIVSGACGGAGDPGKPAGAAASKVETSAWLVTLHNPGSQATLEVPADRPDVLRVKIVRADVPEVGNIQLRRPGISVSDGESFTLSFRARADSPREMYVGASMAHDPWHGLGFYVRVAIGPDWQSFSETFTLKPGDANAQLFFNLGGSSAPVELDGVLLRRKPSGEIVRL